MPNRGPFEGVVALVTGAAQGVGEATARLFAERGAAGLALVDLQEERIESLARELSSAGCAALPLAADLAEVEECFRVVDRTVAHFGTLGCLVNAAGRTDRGTIDDTPPELFDALMAVDARAPFFLIQRCLPAMRRAGGGTIVNVVSITVHGGLPHLAPYVAAKGALAAMTRNIAAAVARDRIRVNGINLGWTLTPAEHRVQTRHHGLPENWAEEAGRSLPFGRLLTAEEAARAIAFLAGPESGLMTGALMDFDQQVVGAYPLPERGEEEQASSSSSG